MTAQPMSALEEVKARVDPYAGQEVFARLARGTVEDISAEDDVVMRWHGLYRHRPQEAGLFMLRLKLPGGAITATQLAAVADVAEQYAHGRVNLTTRQDIELHTLTLADLPAVFAALDAVGLTTLGACGDQVRNVVTCPVAGIDAEELLDTTPVAAALTGEFLQNPHFANLPRKFKLALSGCAQHCVPVMINDLSLVAARNDAGAMGYALWAGGGLSAQPVMVASLEAWVAPEEAVAVAAKAVEIFRDYGNRTQRTKARMKHLLAERGMPWFRAELEARLGRPLPPCTPAPLTLTPDDHLGVHEQHEPGRVFLGIPVPVGQLHAAQLRCLATWATRFGQGRLRLTHRQNIILPDIQEAQLAALQQEVAAAGFTPSPQSWQGRMVVCTGKTYCNKALAHTKETAIRLADALEELIPNAPFTLQMSGCPNGCGQHALADIGLQGSAVKTETGMEERFDLWAGGGAAPAPAFAHRLAIRLHPDELPGTIAGLWGRYQAEALSADETFSAFARRVLHGS